MDERLLHYQNTSLKTLQNLLCMALSAMDQYQELSLQTQFEEGQLRVVFMINPRKEQLDAQKD